MDWRFDERNGGPALQPAATAECAGQCRIPMSLAPGTRRGPYEVLAALGAGGMGEVYKARDNRWDRLDTANRYSI